MAVDWVTLAAGFIGGGLLTDYIGRATDRRTARANLIQAQRALAAARRQDLDTFTVAADEVLRLGVIAGVSQWLNRRYRDVAVAEWRIKRRVPPETRKQVMEEIGEIELISHMALLDPEVPNLKTWVTIIDEYRWTGELFEYAVWHPWRARVKSIAWRRKAKRHEEYRHELAWDGPGE